MLGDLRVGALKLALLVGFQFAEQGVEILRIGVCGLAILGGGGGFRFQGSGFTN